MAAGALAVGLVIAQRPWRTRPPERVALPLGSEAIPSLESTPGPNEISVLSLVNEMSRLDHLAQLPAARFVARQQSSTDRRARDPSDGDTWFANDDFVTDTRPNLVRVEPQSDGGKRYVLLDAEGPGAVVRIWTATPTGTLRIYVDGDPRPALEADMGKLLSGQVFPFEPPFGQTTSMGYTLYFPFPYRKRCVITVDSIVSIDPFSGHPIDKLYYQIGTRSYRPAPDTVASIAESIRSYSVVELNRARPTIARVAAELRAGPVDRPPSGRTTVQIPATGVTKGLSSSTIVAAAPGGGVLTALHLFTRERDPAMLRTTFLSIAFDGEETVRAPLVDFFGTGPGWNPYSSLPLTVGDDGTLACRFPMPFQKRAVLSIVREGPGTVEISGSISVDPRSFESDSLLFHARWRPSEIVRTRPFRDWHIATLGRRGHLVGTVLEVENPSGVAWWGEGDEKIYVDGETFPSIFGTGTEDYFGYAWSSTQLFAHPYHAQTRATGPGFSGQFSMNRFHVLDPIPFESSLRFDLEAWHWSDTSMTMAAILYWYARPSGTDDFPSGQH